MEYKWKILKHPFENPYMYVRSIIKSLDETFMLDGEEYFDLW